MEVAVGAGFGGAEAPGAAGVDGFVDCASRVGGGLGATEAAACVACATLAGEG